MPGRKRSGELRSCSHCMKEFYVPLWKIKDVDRRQGTYCSNSCKYASRVRGEQHGNTFRRTDGYIAVYEPTHPDASKRGLILEHRLVAEQKYGRRIGKHEHVHHLNHIKDDNRPENLQVVHPSLHAQESNWHGAELRAKMREENTRLRQEVEEYKRRYGVLAPQQGEMEFGPPLSRRARRCGRCHASFFPTKATRVAQERYCSNACRLEAIHEKAKAAHAARRGEPRICEWDGRPFYARGERKHTAKYCTKACADAAKRLPNAPKPCERCGAMFTKRFASETAKARFCSDACACRSMTEKRMAVRSF